MPRTTEPKQVKEEPVSVLSLALEMYSFVSGVLKILIPICLEASKDLTGIFTWFPYTSASSNLPNSSLFITSWPNIGLDHLLTNGEAFPNGETTQPQEGVAVGR